MKRRAALLAIGCGSLSIGLPVAPARSFPTKPVRLLVGYAPGAQSDAIARLVAQKLGEILETSVIVENRPGANGTIAVELTAKAAADGHTLGLAGGGNLTLAPAVDSSVRFDAQRDLVALARMARVPLVLAARTDLPVRTAKDLVQYARKNPGKLTYASSGASAQMAIDSLKVSEGLDILTVPYKGTAPALLDVLAGRVDLVLSDVAAAAPLIRDGRLRLIGNAGATRSSIFPDVPTMAEQGVTDFVWESWQGVVAPAALPGEDVVRLREALRQVRAAADFRDSLDRLGFEPIDEAPQVFPSVLRDETDRIRKLVQSIGTRAN